MKELHKEELEVLRLLFDNIWKLKEKTTFGKPLCSYGYPGVHINKKDDGYYFQATEHSKMCPDKVIGFIEKERFFYMMIFTIMNMQREGLLFLVDASSEPSLFLDDRVDSEKENKDKYVDKKIKDKDIVNFITDNYDKCIFPANELIEYVENGKTSEQRRFQKTMFWMRFAFGVSLAALFVALILPFCVETKLAEIGEIKQVIQSSQTKPPAIIKVEITNDTIKVNMVKSTSIKKE